jgi:hypothetical protein
MRITWAVTPVDLGSKLIYREVLCGDESDSNWIELIPDMKYYRHGDYFYQFQYVFTTVIPGLSERCTYEYIIGNGIFWRESRFFSGRTPYYNHPFNQENLDYQPTLLVIGDMGAGNYSQYSRNMFLTEAQLGSYDFSIHLGDIAYNLNSEGGAVANQFMEEIEGFGSEYPYMTVPGNHERFSNFSDYTNRFYMPRNWASQNTSFYYSFNFGRAHFIFFNTESIFYHSEEVQHRLFTWLKEDLMLANKHREEVPWIITFSHKPFYCSLDFRYSMEEKKLANNDDCSQQTFVTRAAYEDLFFKYKADAVIAGHVHNYERNSAIYKGTPIPCDIDMPNHLHNCGAPIHVVTGNAGNHYPFEPVSPTPQDWFRTGAGNSTGYGKLYILNETHIYWEQYNSETGRTIDHFWLSKSRTTYTTSL